MMETAAGPPAVLPEGLPDGLPDENAFVQLLSNTLVLRHTTPYIPITDLLALAATCRACKHLLYETPGVFRYLDLRAVKSAQFDIAGIDHGGETWRNVQLDENLTEDDFYSGPLRGIFSSLRRTNILSDVRVLILDGLAVTADLIHEIITDSSLSVRILSLRDCKHLNQQKLRGALQYACRASRPEGTPRLQGLYFFSKAEIPKKAKPKNSGESRGSAIASALNARSQNALASSNESNSPRDEEPWYGQRGWQFADAAPYQPDWAQTLVDCHGLIAFDAVLCAGPRHLNSPAWGKVDIDALNAASSSAAGPVPQWSVAQYSLRGCVNCGSAPEGWTVWGEDGTSNERTPDPNGRRGSTSASINPDIGRFPLLPHPPLHSSSIKDAMCPSGQSLDGRQATSDGTQTRKARFIPRCAACLRDRYCSACYTWWCESCYTGPLAAAQPTDNASDICPVSRSCWECGANCRECMDKTQRTCRVCGGGYCIIHNEGSNLLHCDWCSSRGRRIRELY